MKIKIGALLLAGGLAAAVGADELVTEGACAAVSPDGRMVAFQRYVGEVMKLGLCELATGRVTWIEEGPGMAAYPTWTPDGALVYMGGYDPETAHVAWKRKSTVGYNLRIWEKGVKRELTTGRCRDYTPAVTPDGKTVYFASTRGIRPFGTCGSMSTSSMLYAMDRAGGVPRLVVGSPNGHNSGVVDPSVSPDGKYLAWGHLVSFFQYWRVYVARRENVAPDAWAPLTPEGLVALSPKWHPDGRLIAFTGFRKGDPGWGVWVEDVRTGFVKRLCDGMNPSFSPDGKFLVYDRERCVWRRDFTAEDRPTAALPGDEAKSRQPERVVASWKGEWTKATALPMGEKERFAFGDRETIFVRARVRDDGTEGVRMFFQGEYAESNLGILLYRNDGFWFATRDGSGRFKGALRTSEGLKGAREHVVTGIRAGNDVYVSIDGEAPRINSVNTSLRLDHPERFWVGKDLHAGEAVLAIEIGTGWPTNVPHAKTREEVVK